MAEQWLSIVEYAKKHDISDMTVRRRIRAGKVEAELREGKYFIRVGTAPSRPDNRSENRAESPVASATPGSVHTGTLRHPDRHLEQLLDRTDARAQIAQNPAAKAPELSYRPAQEQGYRRGTPPAIPVAPPASTAGAQTARAQTASAQTASAQTAAGQNAGAFADRRSPVDRRRSQKQGRRADDFSYPELDLAGTRQPAAGVLDGSHSIDVQLSQLAAKLDHLTQPWQQELLASLKSEITLKDDKIRQLQQKVADLEMIIKMLDSQAGAGREASLDLSTTPQPPTEGKSGLLTPPPPPLIPRT